MSLINQVLKDLEQRHAAEMQTAGAELHGLHYVDTTPANKKQYYRTIWILTATLLCLCVVSMGVVLWPHSSQPISSPIQTATTQQVETTVVKTPEPIAQQAAVIEAPAPVKPKPLPVAKAPMTTTTHVSQAKTPPVVDYQAAKPAPTAKRPITKSFKTPATAATAHTSQSQFNKSQVPLRPEQKAELAYQQGYDYLKGHQSRQAEQVLRQALSVAPNHIKARELLAGMYIKQGRWVEANDLLRDGTRLIPQHHTFTKLYARSLMQMNRDGTAIYVLTQAQHRPNMANDPEYYAILAALYQRQHQHQQAATTYASILKIRPKMGIWWVGMGISLEAMGQAKQAAQAYSHARQSGSLHGDVAKYTDNRLLALQEIDYPME